MVVGVDSSQAAASVGFSFLIKYSLKCPFSSSPLLSEGFIVGGRVGVQGDWVVPVAFPVARSVQYRALAAEVAPVAGGRGGQGGHLQVKVIKDAGSVHG